MLYCLAEQLMIKIGMIPGFDSQVNMLSGRMAVAAYVVKGAESGMEPLSLFLYPAFCGVYPKKPSSPAVADLDLITSIPNLSLIHCGSTSI
jgi:hypothetical protein